MRNASNGSEPVKKAKRSLWEWLIILPCLVYSAGLLVFLALRPSWYAALPFVRLVNNFTPFLFVPLALTLPLALWMRSRMAVASQIVLLVMFAYLYGPYFLPRFRPVGEGKKNSIKVMTFNLGPGQASPEQIVASIESEGADIVAVQELTWETTDWLRTKLGRHYPYRILNPDEETTGLLSRYPIVQSQWFRSEGKRAYLYAEVDWQGVPLNILAVHPFPPGISWYRDSKLPVGMHDHELESQLEEVIQRAGRLNGASLVIGDLNMSDQSPAYGQLSRVLRDAFREGGRGFGFTFPHDLRVGNVPIPGPLLRVDYIFHSASLAATEANVNCDGGSDHCYVVAQLVSVERE